ncbi:hypothetical protein Tco_1546220 [Tanacetum coccineum]
MTWVEGTPAPLGLLWIGGERHEDVKFAIHGLCIDDSLVINARRRADSFIIFRCPQHDLNNEQRVHIFYTGLYIPTRIMLDSKGSIPLRTPTQALKSIQVMADHSRNWYDEATTKERIEGSSDNIDIKQLDENIHVFQVSSKTYEGIHLTEECTLRRKDKAVEQNEYMRSLEETIIKFWEDSIKE